MKNDGLQEAASYEKASCPKPELRGNLESTAQQYLSQFNQHLAKAGTDGKTLKYYQVLLKVGVENGIPTFINYQSGRSS